MKQSFVHTGQAVSWYRCDGKNCPICGQARACFVSMLLKCDHCGQDVSGPDFEAHRSVYCHKPECAAHQAVPLATELRELLAAAKWAVYALEHGSSIEVYWLTTIAKDKHKKALDAIAKVEAVLAAPSAPSGTTDPRVQCITCGEIFVENARPCPKCGSKNIHYKVYREAAALKPAPGYDLDVMCFRCKEPKRNHIGKPLMNKNCSGFEANPPSVVNDLQSSSNASHVETEEGMGSATQAPIRPSSALDLIRRADVGALSASTILEHAAAELREWATTVAPTLRHRNAYNNCADRLDGLRLRLELGKGEPFAYACPANCGCMWRDNKDGTMSLFGRNSSCKVCEPLSLEKLIPVYVDELSEGASVCSTENQLRGGTSGRTEVSPAPTVSGVKRLREALKLCVFEMQHAASLLDFMPDEYAEAINLGSEALKDTKHEN